MGLTLQGCSLTINNCEYVFVMNWGVVQLILFLYFIVCRLTLLSPPWNGVTLCRHDSQSTEYIFGGKLSICTGLNMACQTLEFFKVLFVFVLLFKTHPDILN